MSLRTKMLILSFTLVLFSVLASGVFMLISVSSAFEKELGQRAIAIARTVAQLPDIRDNVGRPGGAEIIQPIAERVRLATNVDYIVIIDMNRIRYSHPSESLIGKVFEGGDEKAALSEHEYISKAYGVQGYAIRAFVPIMDEEGIRQVGVAVVGILTPTFQSLLKQYQGDLLWSLAWGLLVGLTGSIFLAHNIKKQTYNLEPYEIAKLFEERSAVMQAMDMGIIATDEAGRIQFMNKLAKQYTGVGEDPFSGHLSELFRDNWLSSLEDLNRSFIHKPALVRGTMYLVSLHPVYVQEQFAGAVLTMTDHMEAHRLAEELTGIKSLVDDLRAQNHEYMNRLHSIAGLIQLGRTEEALQIILDETENEEHLARFIREHINDYAISGLLLGKYAKAREAGVSFELDPASHLDQVVQGLSSGDVITILGNLLDNAIEACAAQQGEKRIWCRINGDGSRLMIEVCDTGKGMNDEERRNMFKYGYSTKAPDGRGIGLALVKEIVDANQGIIMVDTKEEEGTTVKVEIKRTRGDRHD
ncbi:signal transduction histidine kinase regulating citrate/malate metabolism [Caldalkalibacillus thermarum TA2.A1]|uniref:histidine kinase n=2 Tax=Caldalkalibacillus thermarum (strain TA2.A1) TaxID=986075 RepID=F5L618_CALTT|nr:sensor histidine kinase [Caldalkalibacillus thermarum]EGL83221.1 signal transduction histidine kinase regulating citrate/malate metabolism [Caldalkalibacillus thermarum TA2.A1]